MDSNYLEPAFLAPETVQTRSGWAPRLEYHLVQTLEALHEMRDLLVPATSLAYDTETSGLKVSLGARAIGHAFAAVVAENVVGLWYVPVRHIGPANEDAVQLDPQVVADVVAEILGNADGEVFMHHAKFDMAMARADGALCKRKVWDVAILATAENENERSFKLKSLADLYCFAGASDEDDLLDAWMKKEARGLKLSFKKRSKHTPDEPTYLERFGYSRTPIKLIARYGCRDVFYTLYLFWMRYRHVPDQFPALIKREHRVLEILHEMEWNGLPANPEEIRRAHALAKEELDLWMGRCREITGDPDFSLAGPYLQKLLFGKLQMIPPKQTKTGQSSTDLEARKLLAHQYPEHRELLNAINKAGKVEKLRSTYTLAFQNHYSEATGCIHPTYNQLERREEGGVPVTGRLSSADPNAQNCEKKPIHLESCDCKKCKKERGEEGEPGEERSISVRRYFTVPTHYVRFAADFSQIELRVLTWFSRDPSLLECYANDMDVHAITAEHVTAGDRDVAKQVNFGNSYGMTEIGLARRMAGYYEDPEGTRKRAKVVLDAFFRKYAGIPKFRRMLAAQMRRQLNMFVSPFGRPRRIPELSAPEHWVQARGERMMMSSIISGTAADIMKESMIRCFDYLREHSPKSRLSQTIHDELVFDLYAEPGWATHAVALVRLMEDWPQFARDGVPIKASCKLSTTTWEALRDVTILADGRVQLAA